jgi:hypothetical protein
MREEARENLEERRVEEARRLARRALELLLARRAAPERPAMARHRRGRFG